MLCYNVSAGSTTLVLDGDVEIADQNADVQVCVAVLGGHETCSNARLCFEQDAGTGENWLTYTRNPPFVSKWWHVQSLILYAHDWLIG